MERPNNRQLRWWQSWAGIRQRLREHLNGPFYRAQADYLKLMRERDAEVTVALAQQKDERIRQLEAITQDSMRRVIQQWTSEVLQDKQYWQRLFEHVLAQPLGRALWIEAVYKELDKLSEQERLDLFYNYLQSRDARLKIEFNHPKGKSPTLPLL